MIKPLLKFQVECGLNTVFFFPVQQDQFGRLLPTFIQVIDLTEQEETDYWAVVSAIFDGKQLHDCTSGPSFNSATWGAMESSINNKVCLRSLPF